MTIGCICSGGYHNLTQIYHVPQSTAYLPDSSTSSNGSFSLGATLYKNEKVKNQDKRIRLRLDLTPGTNFA